MTTKNIIITGTHHTPAMELIRQLKNDSLYRWNIYYMTHSYKSETHVENTLKPLLKDNLIKIDCGKYDRNSILKTLKGLAKTLLAIKTSNQIINRIKPNIVVSFGGYVSVPVIIASWLKKIPSITHEQTTTLSLSTKINSFFVNKIALSFPNKDTSPKQIITGNLLRQEIFSKETKTYKKLTKTIIKKPLIFVSGGNQSSSLINKTFISLAKALSSKFTIIHHTGNLDYDNIKNLTKQLPNYYITKYVGPDDIGWVLNNAQIIINRSGANYCQEIVALKKNSILIPLPFSQQNEQLKNAIYVKKQLPSSTVIIDQSKLTLTILSNAIQKLSKHKTDFSKTSPTQNINMLKLLHSYV